VRGACPEKVNLLGTVGRDLLLVVLLSVEECICVVAVVLEANRRCMLIIGVLCEASGSFAPYLLV